MEPALKGVSAFVEVWSSNRTENYSKTFEQQLLDMGAKVSKTLNKHVTHVVFKDGRLTTWKKAQNMGVKIVSVLWVEKCRETGVQVDESLFPAVDTNEGFLLPIKKHKCMQPKDYVEKTPENNRKLQRRLNQMAKELALQKTAVNADTDVPVLLFEDNGSLIYSPVNKIKDQCNEMERRIKDMKEKRENLSPTEEQKEDCLNSSCDYLWKTEMVKTQRTEVAEQACDTWTDIHVSMSTSVNSPSHGHEEKRLTPEQHARSLTKKQIIQPTLDERFSSEKKHFKFLKKNQKNKSKRTSIANESSLLEGFGHITPSKNIVQLNTAPALIDSLSNLPMNSEDLNEYSLDKSFPGDRNYSVLEDRKRKKPQTFPSLKLATSELGASGSMGFLQAITTCSKSYCTEEASYDDFFSSSNSNENEVQIQVPKESQNPPEVCCKDSFTSMDLSNVSFCEPHKTTKISRKMSISVNDFPVKQKIKPAKHPGSTPLNISGGEKDDTGEALDADDVNRLPQHAHEKSYNSVNDCAHTAGEDEVSECHITDASCKIFDKRKDEHTGGLRKAGRLQKPTRTLVMTSMSSEKQNTVIQVVKKLGGFLFSNEVCETTSHVVTGSPRRTLNVMLGVARGCWIVSYEWVLWSLEFGHWISEEPYELSSSFPAAPICRLQRHLSTGKYQQNLFSNQPVMFVSPTSQPPCKKLIELIQLAGGKICKALRQAKICIGKKPGKKYQEIISVSEKWILDSITQYTICPMENYIFQM
ncbi:microcephalin isoform X2 [Serinus canaria]|uniref:microcephalin isoform X2 n=1 Tax=Serinus canaria TaxID=9135 RepID=UPI0011AE4F24|nr:microcephalin isoform X2 [Serinus canaria]